MQYKPLLMAALLLLPGCGAKHEIEHDAGFLDITTPFGDTYIDRRGSQTKTYTDYYFRPRNPDGKLNSLIIEYKSGIEKIITIDYESSEETIPSSSGNIRVCIPANSPEAKEIQKDFEDVKAAYQKQESAKK